MSLVLCITRGDEAGIRVQDEAIAFARDRVEALAFLFVADFSFLNKTAMIVPWRHAEEELVKLGEFLLGMALERATAEGVEAEAVIRSGVLRDVLPKVVREMEATTIFLEHPVGETCRFDASELERILASSRVGRNK